MNNKFLLVFCLLISSLFLNSVNIIAQAADSRIDIYNPNMKLLEFLVKLEIDSIRKVNFLKPLYNDSICFLAAREQGEFLLDYDDITHYQEKNPAKRSPQDRANFFGAKGYRVGENIVKLYVDIPFLYSMGAIQMKNVMIRTYEETAKFIVQAWIHSAEHYINILSPLYNVTGIFAVFNEDDRSLICVQVFAAVDKNYHLKSYPSVFPYQKFVPSSDSVLFSDTTDEQNCNFNNAWNLSLEIDHSNPDSTGDLGNIVSNCFVLYKDHDLYINFGLYDKTAKLFKGEYDGLALEIVPAQIYYCKNQAWEEYEFPENCPVKGMITKPVYRDKLLKKNYQLKDVDMDQKYLIPMAGSIPDRDPDSFETNILIIKDRKIWRIIQTHHLCGKLPVLNILPGLYTGMYPQQNIYLDSLSNHPAAETNPMDTSSANTEILTRLISEYNHIYREFLLSCDKNEYNCPGDTAYVKMDSIQKYLFRMYLEQKIDFDRIRSLPVLIRDKSGEPARNQPFGKLYYDRIMFEFIHEQLEFSNDSLFNILSMLKKFRNPLPEVLYNYWVLNIRLHRQNIEANFSPALQREIVDVIDRSRGTIPGNFLDSLALFYHFTRITKSYQSDLIDIRQVFKSLEFMYDFYMEHQVSVAERIKIARLFIAFRMYNLAFQLLEPVVKSHSFHKEAFILYLKLYYSGMIGVSTSEDYYSQLIEASNYLTDEEWLGLFEGPCRINFQNLNYKPLRMLYCAKKRALEINGN